MFKQNEGIIDRTVRVVVALVLLLAGLLLGVLQGSVLGLVVTGISVFPLFTGLTGFCPLYIPLGINTLEKEKELIARCRSMMAGFRHGSAGSGDPGVVQNCGSCAPANGTPHTQQGETEPNRA